jgi:hypothetical protein
MFALACLVTAALMIMFASSCNKGETKVYLTGYEESLPPELKGLKVYLVKTGALSNVKVAILNGQVNSATYPVGKSQETTIIFNQGWREERIVIAKGIIYENDSILVIRK